MEWTKREAVLQRDRDFYSAAFTDPNTSALAAIRINTAKYQPSATNFPNPAAVAALYGRPGISGTSPFFFNPDGSLYKDTNAVGFDGTLNDGTYRLRNNGVLVENYRDGNISSPLNRYSIFGKADYKINDRGESVRSGDLRAHRSAVREPGDGRRRRLLRFDSLRQ